MDNSDYIGRQFSQPVPLDPGDLLDGQRSNSVMRLVDRRPNNETYIFAANKYKIVRKPKNPNKILRSKFGNLTDTKHTFNSYGD